MLKVFYMFGALVLIIAACGFAEHSAHKLELIHRAGDGWIFFLSQEPTNDFGGAKKACADHKATLLEKTNQNKDGSVFKVLKEKNVTEILSSDSSDKSLQFVCESQLRYCIGFNESLLSVHYTVMAETKNHSSQIAVLNLENRWIYQNSTVANFTCKTIDTGVTALNPNSTCNSSKWTHLDPKCQKTCPPHKEPETLHYVYSGNPLHDGRFPKGTELSPDCRKGDRELVIHNRQDTKILCGASGKWEHDLKQNGYTCKKKCHIPNDASKPELPVPADEKASDYTRQGEQVLLKCQEGYGFKNITNETLLVTCTEAQTEDADPQWLSYPTCVSGSNGNKNDGIQKLLFTCLMIVITNTL